MAFNCFAYTAVLGRAVFSWKSSPLHLHRSKNKPIPYLNFGPTAPSGTRAKAGVLSCVGLRETSRSHLASLAGPAALLVETVDPFPDFARRPALSSLA